MVINPNSRGWYTHSKDSLLIKGGMSFSPQYKELIDPDPLWFNSAGALTFQALPKKTRYFGIVGNGKLHVLDIAAPGTPR